VLFVIAYDYSTQVCGETRTYTSNVVGREGVMPVGYGPNGPAGHFRGEDLTRVWNMLVAQLGTSDITLHLWPAPEVREV
jgi:hypothetical protein